MVTTAANDEETAGVVAERRPSISRMACPRCSSQLRVNYDEPECLQCGYVDYSYIPAYPITRKRNVLSAGTYYVLRYVGNFPSLKNALTHLRLQPLGNRLLYNVCCPFCGQSMTQLSASGKLRDARERRFKCGHGHRVSVLSANNGSLGWK